jgi:hypothetical protein
MALAGGVSMLTGDQMKWAFDKGFSEVQIVVHHWPGQGAPPIPDPNPIHDAGIKVATLNIYNDQWGPYAGSADAEYPIAQAVNKAGWDMIAGEGVSSQIVDRIIHELPYCHYAGSGGAGDPDGVGCSQINAYQAPWAHPAPPAGDIKGHCDYVETYCGPSGWVQPCPKSTISTILDAHNYGECLHSGILIGMWDRALSFGIDYFVDIINKCKESNKDSCDTVLFWIGYDTNGVTQFQSKCEGLFRGFVDRFGIEKQEGLSASVSKETNKMISIGFANARRGVTSKDAKVDSKIKITGRSGYKDADGNFTTIPNPQKLYKYRIWSDADGNEHDTEIDQFYPDPTNGTFSFEVTWPKRETIKYKVGLMGGG